MIEIPVFIPAHNEAKNIRRTLRWLPKHGVIPIVLPNWCTDNTADIARGMGALVIESDEPGKLPAIQKGMREALGKRAREPFITLDADTRPLMPRRWAAAMLAARAVCPPNAPGVAVGPSVYFGHNDPIMAARWTIRHYRRQQETAHDNNAGGFYGRNLLFDLHDDDTVEEVLSLAHFWPGEDRAMKDVAVEHGGSTFKSPDWEAACVTSARRFHSLYARLTLGREAATADWQDSYNADAIPGSVPYMSYEESVLGLQTLPTPIAEIEG